MSKIVLRQDMASVAKELLEKVSLFSKDVATIVFLLGDLGAGKTTLTQEIAKEFGIKEKVNSPTFVVMKIYEIKNKKYKFKKLIHIDAYRLEEKDSLDFLRLTELLSDKENILLVEWPEKIKREIKKCDLVVSIKHKDQDSRIFDFLNQ